MADDKERTVIIRGSEWQRGEGNICSLLYNQKTERACCLGLAGDQIYGIPLESLNGFAAPQLFMYDQDRLGSVKYSEYREDWTMERRSGTLGPNRRAELAMPINDNMDTTDDEKIAALRPIFLELDIEIDWRPEE